MVIDPRQRRRDRHNACFTARALLELPLVAVLPLLVHCLPAYSSADSRVIDPPDPTTSSQLGRIVTSLARATTVDGSIIGSVPGEGKRPALYVAGERGAISQVEALFAGTDVLVRNLGPEVGRASSLKLAYSAFQKGSRVLAALAQALADNHGVGAELLLLADQRSGSYLSEPEYVAETAALGWRWAPELAAAADELNSVGLPGQAIAGLGEVLDMWSGSRDNWGTPQEAIEALRSEDRRG
ncbi:DUF1932 domain-containing protein [Kribbella qitaiheensis]|uniref:DUF1932 domain-containing protein n=1 Tax=Kribbella qitaiheensis TaxID=1544730 RepID=UPI003D18CFD9